MQRSKSQALFARAARSIPGGVNSPVRAFRGVGGDPVFFESGDGAYLKDVDGNRYIDYVSSWGPMLLGHRHGKVIEAVRAQAGRALGFGAPTEQETVLAELVASMVPGIEKVRLVNSGTEATMTAIRLARGFTRRDLVVKFDGCYHGHSDSLLVKAGSGLLTLGIPGSPGVPESVAAKTLTVPFNDLEAVRQAFDAYPGQVAAVILEPIAGNMGCVPPVPRFLDGLRALATAAGSLLIFDEVMTGFRVARGGAQGLYGVTPDLTTLGKIIGGGLPIGAVGGSAAIMDYLAPDGPVYQAGTLSGNPLAVAAGIAMLTSLDEDFYPVLAERTERLAKGFRELAVRHNRTLTVNFACGMFSLFFDAPVRVTEYTHVARSDVETFNRFFHGMLARGIYLAPSAYEAGFLGLCHTPDVLEATLSAADDTFSHL